MEKISPDEFRSPDLVAQNISQLKALFPEAFTEGKIDFEVLKQLLGRQLDEREEKYGLNWHGKRRARQLALTPSLGTLRPCPSESVDWDTTQNLMIEGDNLEVLKLLQKSYAGRVKLIYIDPPYNTGKDFVYHDDFRDNIKNYLQITGQINGNGHIISSHSESSGRFHTDWLNMMYPRLKLARNLLSNDGVLFVSIDEREYAHLRMICADIFGEENLIGTIIWKNATDNNPTQIATEHEYILVVGRSRDALESEWKSDISDVKEILAQVGRDLAEKYDGEDLIDAYQSWYREHKSELWPLDRYKYIDSGGVYTGSQSVHNPGKEGYRYDVIHPLTGKPCKQPLMGYRFPKETMDDLIRQRRIIFGEDETKIVELKVYASEYREKLSSILDLDGRLGAYDLRNDFPNEGKVFTNPKPVRLLSTLFSYVLRKDGDIALDFFAGSGAAGRAVQELNSHDNIHRRYILVQLPEPLEVSNPQHGDAIKLCRRLNRPLRLSEITKERLRRAATETRRSNPKLASDLGFRVMRLDSSSLRVWEPNPNDLEQMMIDHVDHIVPGRTEQDLLFEILIKRGLDLCSPIDQRHIANKTAYTVGGILFACLTDEIKRAETEELALGIVKWREELAPEIDSTVVFRDSAFFDDVAKSNITEILKQHGFVKVESL